MADLNSFLNAFKLIVTGLYGSYGTYGGYGKKAEQKEGHSRAHRRRKG